MNFKDRLRRFMYGRNGMDSLSKWSFYISIVSFVIYLLTRSRWANVISTILIVYSMFRIYSRNTQKRYQENLLFLEKTKPICTTYTKLKMRWQNRKIYRYLRCPKCKTEMKVPKNKGTLRIKCPKCGHQFEKKV